MTSSPQKIEPPVIEFPKGSTTSSTTADRVVDALKSYGCFMATYENLKENRSRLFKASKEIFDHLDKTNSGKPEFAHKKKDQYEIFDIPEATTNQGIEKFIPKKWPGPGGQVDIRNAIRGYTTTAAELEGMVRKIVFKHYEIPEKSTGYIFQMMKYKNEVRLDFSNREDKFLAVLDLNQVNGLKMTAADGKCFSINVRPSTFLIMAGNTYKDWKEVKIHEDHGNEEKYSVGLFSYCNKAITKASKGQDGSSGR